MNWLLSPAGLLYRQVAKGRNWMFEAGLRKPVFVDRPVISVGNVTVGGTGKTPFIEHLIQWSLNQSWRPGVVSRGYKGRFQGIQRVQPEGSAISYGDEPFMLAAKYPEVPVYVGRDRVAACQRLVAEQDVDIVVVDDGFQHRRLGRAVDIVVLDATQSLTDYRPLPWGLGREEVSALKRADVVVLNKVNLVGFQQLTELREMVDNQTGGLKDSAVVESRYHIEGLCHSGTGEKVSSWEGEHLFLVSGIGRPETFETLLQQSQACTIAGHMVYADHHAYTDKDLKQIEKAFLDSGATRLVTTNKDAVKMKELGVWTAELAVRLKGAREAVYEKIRRSFK